MLLRHFYSSSNKLGRSCVPFNIYFCSMDKKEQNDYFIQENRMRISLNKLVVFTWYFCSVSLMLQPLRMTRNLLASSILFTEAVGLKTETERVVKKCLTRQTLPQTQTLKTFFFSFIPSANPVSLFTGLEFSLNFSASGKNELWLM